MRTADIVAGVLDVSRRQAGGGQFIALGVHPNASNSALQIELVIERGSCLFVRRYRRSLQQDHTRQNMEDQESDGDDRDQRVFTQRWQFDR